MPRRLKNLPNIPNSFTNGEVHEWHTIIWGYSDKVVSALIDRFRLTPKDILLDPFCGYGTTLVECKKRGIPSVGIDANPAAVYSSKVKTDWTVDVRDLEKSLVALRSHYLSQLADLHIIKSDPTYQYLLNSGMIERSWITPLRLSKIIALKRAIQACGGKRKTKALLTLLLSNVFVRQASNVRFGPELYCARPRANINVFKSFIIKSKRAISDLEKVKKISLSHSSILRGDSRNLKGLEKGLFTCVITSPPYPAEHDYTRNTRLELALLESVTSNKTLRKIKQTMLRSHTKGIYKTDADGYSLRADRKINMLCGKIDNIAKSKKYGFARLYSKVVREYFGGMSRHFTALHSILKPGARCAYVVGDQRSYFGIHIQTSKFLGRLARASGFINIRDQRVRNRRATVGNKVLDEHILMFRKPSGKIKPAETT